MLSYALTCGLLISLLTSRAVKNTLVYNNATTVHGGKLECFTVLILYYHKSNINSYITLQIILYFRIEESWPTMASSAHLAAARRC